MRNLLAIFLILACSTCTADKLKWKKAFQQGARAFGETMGKVAAAPRTPVINVSTSPVNCTSQISGNQVNTQCQ